MKVCSCDQPKRLHLTATCKDCGGFMGEPKALADSHLNADGVDKRTLKRRSSRRNFMLRPEQRIALQHYADAERRSLQDLISEAVEVWLALKRL